MSDVKPLSAEELRDIKQSIDMGHGNGGGDARWNARWLATLDAERAASNVVEKSTGSASSGDAAPATCPYCGGAGCLPCRGRGTVGPAFWSNRGLSSGEAAPADGERWVKQRVVDAEALLTLLNSADDEAER